MKQGVLWTGVMKARIWADVYLVHEGKIVDASFVEVPRQHKRAKRANTSWRSATRTQGKSCEHGTEGDRGSLDKEKQRVIFWL